MVALESRTFNRPDQMCFETVSRVVGPQLRSTDQSVFSNLTLALAMNLQSLSCSLLQTFKLAPTLITATCLEDIRLSNICRVRARSQSSQLQSDVKPKARWVVLAGAGGLRAGFGELAESLKCLANGWEQCILRALRGYCARSAHSLNRGHDTKGTRRQWSAAVRFRRSEGVCLAGYRVSKRPGEF